MTRAGIRLFLAACAVLLIGAGVLRVRDTAAQDAHWTLNLIATFCPSDHTPESGYAECTVPNTHLEMSFHAHAPDGPDVPFETGSGGGTRVGLDGAGLGGTITVSMPAGVDRLEITCTDGDGNEFAASTDGNEIIFPMQEIAGEISCRLYLIEAIDAVIDDYYGLGSIVTMCTQGLEGTVWWVAEFCSAPDGVGISFADANGETLLDCVADNPNPDPKGAGCSLEIPYGSDPVTVTLDTSTIPDGYELVSQNPQIWDIPTEPPTGLLGGPFFLLLPTGSDVPEDLEEQAGSTPPPADQTSQVEGRTVVLYSGDCDNLGEEIATLNDVLPEEGDKVGDEKAIPAEMSATTGSAFFLDAAIDEGAALVIYEDDTTDTAVACGDLGGANTHDGMLPIGLGEVDDSGVVGTAVLSYNADNDTTTDVTIVISADLLPEPTGTPAP